MAYIDFADERQHHFIKTDDTALMASFIEFINTGDILLKGQFDRDLYFDPYENRYTPLDINCIKIHNVLEYSKYCELTSCKGVLNLFHQGVVKNWFEDVSFLIYFDNMTAM